MGHVRDLPKNKLGVNTDREFSPWYEVPEDKRKVVAEIKAAGDNADGIYLATDPDREGEAIAWHVLEAAGWKGKPIRRVVFHSITEEAVREAFENERDIDMELVNAQQARRIEDRLLGFKLSPLLKQLLGHELNRLSKSNDPDALDLDVSTSLSAGRVQSVALRLVAERDNEIAAFVAVEYWSIDASLKTDNGAAFSARLHGRLGARRKIELGNEAAASAVLGDLEGARYLVASVTQREVKETPRPPFITSTLQQEAAGRLRFSTTKTMTVAQQLYEGIDVGPGGPVGLITYMRTDSPQVAPSAVNEARQYIAERWGKNYVPKSPRLYRTRSKVAQEAHEAIRPTSAARTPASVRAHLSNDQFRLYQIIWNRMVASQMADALVDRTEVAINAETVAPERPNYEFRVSGSVMRFPGFQVLYREAPDEPDTGPEGGSEAESDQASDTGPDAAGQRQPLPQLRQDQPLGCEGLTPEQHFTQPPRRFTEASLVRALEERGIGRPSTYVATINTIVSRKYVTRDRRVLQSTKLGQIVCKQLIAHFPDIMDVEFTGRMEGQLDDVANGKQEWVALLHGFYGPFSEELAKAKTTLKEAAAEALNEPSAEPCDLCGKPMIIKVGRFGPFLACTGYPECKHTKDIARSGEDATSEQAGDESTEVCEICGKPMAMRRGRFGPFLACTGYPECKGKKNVRKEIGVPCPKCSGALVERRSKRGVFYGCSNYPTCKFTVNSLPLPRPCPECEGLLVAAANDQSRCTNCAWKGPIPEAAPVSTA